MADTQIKRFGLRTGDLVSGPIRPPKDTERYWSLLRVQTINGAAPEDMRNRPHFEDLTPIYPNERLHLETEGPAGITGRFLDIVTPVGRGPARSDRRPAQGRQDDDHQADRQQRSPRTTPTSS